MEKLNVLCFGDSLTEGYSGWGSSWTPYGEHLEKRLYDEFELTKVSVEIDGVSGDFVDESHGSFVRRIRKICDKAKEPFDWIIILGGTNDLSAPSKSPEDIFDSLKKVYDTATMHGANVLALTIPECAAKIASLDTRRNSLNAMIKEYKPEGVEDRFHTFDLFATMPYHSESEEVRENVWDDGLHFTPYGYEVMGKNIAQRMVELVYSVREPKNVRYPSIEK